MLDRSMWISYYLRVESLAEHPKLSVVPIVEIRADRVPWLIWLIPGPLYVAGFNGNISSPRTGCNIIRRKIRLFESQKVAVARRVPAGKPGS